MLAFAGCLRCLDPLCSVRAGAVRGVLCLVLAGALRAVLAGALRAVLAGALRAVLAGALRAGPAGALSAMLTGALRADRVGFRCRASAWGITGLQSERRCALLPPRYRLQSASCVRTRCWVRAAGSRLVAIAHVWCCWLTTMHPIAPSRRQNAKDTRSHIAHIHTVRAGLGRLALEADLGLGVGEADRPVHPDGNIQRVGKHD
jgi:hypothetical protein